MICFQNSTWFFKATAASGVYCRNGRVSFEKTKKMGFFEVDKSVWTCFPPIPIRCTCTCLHFRATPHPHCPSHTIQWNAKQECSNFWINHIWYNILAKVRSSPEVKSTREKRKKNCHTDQNIQLGRSLKSVNSGESGLPAGHSPPSPSFPDRRYHHWCHRHQCTIIFVWP